MVYSVLIIALILDLIVIGPLAKKMAFKLPMNLDTNTKKMITISCLTIFGMVACMSLLSLITHSNLEGNILTNYLIALILNAIFAFPLQLLFVGPISRKLLAIYQNKSTSKN